MQSSAEKDNSSRNRVAPPDVSVSNWFLRDGGLTAWSFALLCVVLAVAAARMTNHTQTGVICFLALAITSWRLWIPVRFELGTNGIAQKSLGYERRLNWMQFHDCEFRRHGVLLLPSESASASGGVRPVYILWSNQREAIRAVVEFYVGRSRQAGSSVTRVRIPDARPGASSE